MHEIEIKARFCETDALGHINNASYFIYFEEARTRFLEQQGFSLEAKKWNFILASTKCDFVSQGYFNQVFTVRTTVSNIGTKSFILKHEIICKETKKLIAKGNDVMVFFDFNKQESDIIPDFLREGLKAALVYE